MITQVYGGRAAITFHEAKHYYTVSVPGIVENLYQPSVTTILGMKDKSNALLPWAVGAMADQVMAIAPELLTKELLGKLLNLAKSTYREKTKAAGDIGTVVHRALEQEMLQRAGLAPREDRSVVAPGFTPEMTDSAAAAIEAGMRFFSEHTIDIIQIEAPRWSATHGYVGTGDLIARFDGDLAVLDYKTSKAIYAEYFLQAAAYQVAYTEEFPEQEITKRVIVHVGRDGKLATQTKDNDTLEADFHVFKSLLAVWRWDQENSGRYSKPAPRVLGPLTNL